MANKYFIEKHGHEIKFIKNPIKRTGSEERVGNSTGRRQDARGPSIALPDRLGVTDENWKTSAQILQVCGRVQDERGTKMNEIQKKNNGTPGGTVCVLGITTRHCSPHAGIKMTISAH